MLLQRFSHPETKRKRKKSQGDKCADTHLKNFLIGNVCKQIVIIVGFHLSCNFIKTGMS